MDCSYKLFDNKKLKIVARIWVSRVTMEHITRFGVSIEPELLDKFDKLIEQEGKFTRKVWGLLSLELWQQEFHDKAETFRKRKEEEK